MPSIDSLLFDSRFHECHTSSDSRPCMDNYSFVPWDGNNGSFLLCRFTIPLDDCLQSSSSSFVVTWSGPEKVQRCLRKPFNTTASFCLRWFPHFTPVILFRLVPGTCFCLYQLSFVILWTLPMKIFRPHALTIPILFVFLFLPNLSFSSFSSVPHVVLFLFLRHLHAASGPSPFPLFVFWVFFLFRPGLSTSFPSCFFCHVISPPVCLFFSQRVWTSDVQVCLLLQLEC